MYTQGPAKEYFVPICHTVEEMLYVLDINDARFKIVTDLAHAK